MKTPRVRARPNPELVQVALDPRFAELTIGKLTELSEVNAPDREFLLTLRGAVQAAFINWMRR